MFRAAKATKQVLAVRSIASAKPQARVQQVVSSSSISWGVVAAGEFLFLENRSLFYFKLI